MRSRYVKFICPNCHKQFRQRLYLPKDGNYTVEAAEGLFFELHVHCPRCEWYIPYADKRN